jgi:hypothetical protein
MNILRLGILFFALLAQTESLALKGRIFGHMRGGSAKKPSIWDSHKPINTIPDTLVSSKSTSALKQRMEKVCRDAQVLVYIYDFSHAILTFRYPMKSSICKAIEELDGSGKFRTDAWSREGGGGGISKVLAGSFFFAENVLQLI